MLIGTRTDSNNYGCICLVTNSCSLTNSFSDKRMNNNNYSAVSIFDTICGAVPIETPTDSNNCG